MKRFKKITQFLALAIAVVSAVIPASANTRPNECFTKETSYNQGTSTQQPKKIKVKTVTEGVEAVGKAENSESYFKFVPETTSTYEIVNKSGDYTYITDVLDNKLKSIGVSATYKRDNMAIRMTAGKTYYVKFWGDNPKILIRKLKTNKLKKGKTMTATFDGETGRIWLEYKPTEDEELVLYTTGAKSTLSSSAYVYDEKKPFDSNGISHHPTKIDTRDLLQTYFFQSGATYFICIFPSEYDTFKASTFTIGLRKPKSVDSKAEMTKIYVPKLDKDGKTDESITLKISMPENSSSKPTDYVVLCYSYHYYAKPTWEYPFTRVFNDDTLTVSMGNDRNATILTLMLVSAENSKSKLGNYSTMKDEAVDLIEIERDSTGKVRAYRPMG